MSQSPGGAKPRPGGVNGPWQEPGGTSLINPTVRRGREKWGEVSGSPSRAGILKVALQSVPWLRRSLWQSHIPDAGPSLCLPGQS